MSRFSHRQTVWTLGPVVLLSTLLLSPVTASIVLRVFLQSIPHDGLQTTVRLAEQASSGHKSPFPPESTETDRLSGEPRRTEEESAEEQGQEGERFVPRPENEPEIHSPVAEKTSILADIAVRLPTRVVLTIPDDVRLALLPPPPDLRPHGVYLPSVPPRAPPV